MIEERAAQRNCSMASRTSAGSDLRKLRGIDLPDLLKADAEFRRFAYSIQGKFRDQLLAKPLTRPFREQRDIYRAAPCPGRRMIAEPSLAIPINAGRDATHRAFFIIKHFGCGKARVNLYPKRLGLARKPTTDIAELCQ